MRFWLTTTLFRLFYARTINAALAIALLLAALGQSQAADPEPKRVLMLHSFGLRFKPWTDHARITRSEITRQSQAPVDFLDHSLVDARQFNEKSEASFVEYLHNLYDDRPPHLIIAFGAPAANFVQRHREQLFPRIPMVFTSVEQRRIQWDKLTEYDTVVAIKHDLPALIENILHVLPLTKTIAIVNGASPNEKFWLGELRREFTPFVGRVELKWYNELSFENILKDAANLPPHSAIFWHLMNIDAVGAVHEENVALNKLASVSKAPIFTYADTYYGEAIVGGPMHSYELGAMRTAAAALRLLNGEKASDIKIPPSPFAPPKFDWRQMQRWGISESSLPPGSKIDFRELTILERYSWQIALIVAVLLIQTGLITVLLREHRRRQFAEVQSRQRMAELAHFNRFSTAGELTASIAHEINQPLGAILTNTETAQAILKSPNPDINELNEILGDILKDDRRATEVIRRMRSLLKKTPFELKNFDLNDVVQETLRFLSALTVGRKFEMVNVITPDALPILGDRIQLQQVILNLVMNGIEAMKDTPDENRIINIRTARVGKFAELSVSDRGPGIPEDKLKEVFEPFYTSKAEGMGMGLSIARTIIEAHNGLISAKNRDHGGATFRVRLPLAG
jgi:signal transduction histidine kinase/ABC-type uncharacterized transport system substrate-binding protein